MRNKNSLTLTPEGIRRYAVHLLEQERAAGTAQKYAADLSGLCQWMGGRPLTKAALIEWKADLIGRYAPASVNSKLAAVNGFLAFSGHAEMALRQLKIQKAVFCDKNLELSRAEYARLVAAAREGGCERLSLVIQTICATGIRVSELRFITAEAIRTGRAEVSNKGKRRTVFLPNQLRQVLGGYLQKQKRTAGAVFVTRTGEPLDRSNIWRDMKRLCSQAGVAPEKVFPHNLRHLFARTYYSKEKDLSRLADLLGHSSVNTTRIYTMESGGVHAKQMERLGLVLTT